MLTSILESVTGTLSIQSALICTGVSLVLGIMVAGCYMLQGKYTKNYVITLALLPALVQVVIMLVNGNLGTGIAIMGAFSLVRFRSLPGTSREITGVFFAMVIGLATGMGYLTYGAIITVIVGVSMILLNRLPIGDKKQVRAMKITIPENLDYEGIFEPVFDTYTKQYSLDKVKTTNMGSMYELSYQIEMKAETSLKKFMDELRVYNGNLTIVCGRVAESEEGLL